MNSNSAETLSPSLQVALARGFIGRCPNCGQGKLFRAYLKQVDRCAECNERFGDIESDDAAPWFTMLITGLASAPLYFLFQTLLSTHFVLTMFLLVLIIIALILVLLPRVKGTLLSAFWRSRHIRDASSNISQSGHIDP